MREHSFDSNQDQLDIPPVDKKPNTVWMEHLQNQQLIVPVRSTGLICFNISLMIGQN